MTITVPLDPQEEAKLAAVAHARGISTGELVRSALDTVLDSATASSEVSMGAALVAVMQASPHREVDLDAARAALPVRDVGF